MSDDRELTAVERIEKRRAERKALLASQREEQLAVDLEALDALEVEHGDDRIGRVNLNVYHPGLPTLICVRLPSPAEFKRYQDMAKRKEKDIDAPVKAAKLLADSCVVYPPKEVYEKVLEVAGCIHLEAAMHALEMFSGKVADEGKG